MVAVREQEIQFDRINSRSFLIQPLRLNTRTTIPTCQTTKTQKTADRLNLAADGKASSGYITPSYLIGLATL